MKDTLKPGLTYQIRFKIPPAKTVPHLCFTLSAHDGVDTITEGTHERFAIDAERFGVRVAEKVHTAST